MFQRLMLNSDPLLSLLHVKKDKKHKEMTDEMKRLLINQNYSDTDEESVDDNESIVDEKSGDEESGSETN